MSLLHELGHEETCRQIERSLHHLRNPASRARAISFLVALRMSLRDFATVEFADFSVLLAESRDALDALTNPLEVRTVQEVLDEAAIVWSQVCRLR